MAKKSKNYPGVYSITCKKGCSHGIDYVHRQTGQRVRKILKAKTEAEADDLRSIEIADAQRGAMNKTYGIKAQGKPLLFDTALDEYLKWSRENKKSWATDGYRAGGLRKKLAGKLVSDITPLDGGAVQGGTGQGGGPEDRQQRTHPRKPGLREGH